MDKIFKCLGASNHCGEDRQNEDYYATDPKAIDALLSMEKFQHNVWEIACGEGHLAKRLEHYGHKVLASDLIDRGFGYQVDFLTCHTACHGDIITNPPFQIAQAMIERSLSLIDPGAKAAFFLKLLFLEGQKRRKFYDATPPKNIYVFSKRIKCAKNGEFDKVQASAVAYAWFVWEKGFTGNPKISWV